MEVLGIHANQRYVLMRLLNLIPSLLFIDNDYGDIDQPNSAAY